MQWIDDTLPTVRMWTRHRYSLDTTYTHKSESFCDCLFGENKYKIGVSACFVQTQYIYHANAAVPDIRGSDSNIVTL